MAFIFHLPFCIAVFPEQQEAAKLALVGQLPAAGWDSREEGGRKSEEHVEMLNDAVASTQCSNGHNQYLDQRRS